METLVLIKDATVFVTCVLLEMYGLVFYAIGLLLFDVPLHAISAALGYSPAWTFDNTVVALQSVGYHRGFACWAALCAYLWFVKKVVLRAE